MLRENTGKGPKQFSLKVGADTQLMTFLLSKLGGYSRSAVKSLLSHRQVLLNDDLVITRHDHELHAGDRISIRSAKSMSKVVFEHPMVKLLYEDEVVIVVEKSAGFLSVGTDREKERTVYHVLNQYMKAKGRNNRIYVVHRLDRDTSGLMLFAKTEDAQQKLQKNWDDMVIERTYIAIAEGEVVPPKGEIRSYLTEDKQMRMHASETDNGGQLAITRYEVLRSNKGYSLLQLNLETGRKNQIRVQLQSIGHPVSGDKKYGGQASPAKRLCLHAATLKFKHPVSGKPMSFTLPAPASFSKLI
ncbi:MAG: RluA family pseudouridine synthase [Paludibacteraceae bacterium]|nr:RluA family pseudouridine synthase [Paludibacteraceae bacterium]